jgi:hypothetical protein
MRKPANEAVGVVTSADPVVALVGRDQSVHQAVGMVSAQLNSDVVDAASRLVAYAESTGQTLPQAAQDVLSRKKRFS